MKPVTLPLLKSLYYVLFAMVVVIVLGGCEKDDENEIRFYTGNGFEERLLGEEGLLMDILQTPAMIFLKAASGDQIKVRSEDTAVVDATYNPDYLGKRCIEVRVTGVGKTHICVSYRGEEHIIPVAVASRSVAYSGQYRLEGFRCYQGSSKGGVEIFPEIDSYWESRFNSSDGFIKGFPNDKIEFISVDKLRFSSDFEDGTSLSYEKYFQMRNDSLFMRSHAENCWEFYGKVNHNVNSDQLQLTYSIHFWTYSSTGHFTSFGRGHDGGFIANYSDFFYYYPVFEDLNQMTSENDEIAWCNVSYSFE